MNLSRFNAGGSATTEFDAHIAARLSMIWMCDADGLCDFVCPSWSAFSGREVSRELGTGWLDQVHSDDLSDLTRQLAQAMQARQPFQLLYRYRRADGVFRWLVHQGNVRATATGEFLGYVGQCVDVTGYTQSADDPLDQEWSAERMISLLKDTRLIGIILDRQGRVLFSNDSLSRLLKLEAGELTGIQLFPRYLAPADRALFETIYPDGTQNACFPAEFESALVVDGGEIRNVLWHAISLQKYRGHADSTILIGDDISESRRAEEQLKLTARVFDSSSQAMVITTPELNIISVNRAFTECTGYSTEDALGKTTRLLKSGRHDQAFYEQMWKSIKETGHWRGDVWDRHKSGSIYPEFLSISAIKDEQGAVTNYAAIFYEISERKAIEERLDLLAHYDALTGLSNRSLLLDRLKQSVERAIRGGTRVVLLFIDLDHFKQINDTWGHATGDLLLQAVAQRLKQCVRAADTVARLGGDEFVVLLPDIKDVDAVAQLAQKILDALTPPYELDGKSLTSTPSIGISIYPDDHDDADTLLEHADRAMYQAKQQGHGNFKFFRDIACDAPVPRGK